MTRVVLFLALFLHTASTNGQGATRTWHFGAYSVRSYDTTITILRDNTVLYHAAGGDPVTYTFVDTLTLNRDGKPDFVYMYVDEYYVVGILVSQPRGYRDIFVGDIFEFQPSLYKVSMPLPAPILPIVLRDIDGDGRRDMIVGGLDRKTDYTIPGYTETVRYTELRRMASAKVKPKPKKGKSVTTGR